MNTVQRHQPGSPNLDFGVSGELTLRRLDLPEEFNGTRLVKGLALQPDGKIIIGAELFNGKSDRSVYALIRLHTDGSLDKTFAEQGIQSASFVKGQSCGSGKVRVLADGKLLLLGWTLREDDGWAHLVIARFNQNGNVDEGFGDHGRLIIENAERSKFVVTSETMQTTTQDNFFVTANYVDPHASDHFSGRIFSVRPDGSWNTDFNGTGRLDFRVDTTGPFTAVNACLEQGDKLLVAGNALWHGLDHAYVARISHDGQLDQRFGDPKTPGLHILRINQKDCKFNDLNKKSDGSLACFGQCGADAEPDSQGLLTLLTPNGTPHRIFNRGQPLLTHFDGASEGVRWRCGYIQQDGRIVALSGDLELYLARILPDGQADQEFGNLGHVKLNNADVGKLPPCQLVARSDNYIFLSFNFEHLSGLGRIDSYIG
ncbi:MULTISPECIES: hypothetical protein [Pseudomonas]|uniref:hypothetical protein n=1 Tax=Pseudomonas TaxID=286 RepID=UPI00215CD97E|nr:MULTISPECIES: hypothetical protein [unclassified Pseudomonas]MCR8933020.1 hypothetical protein [Pseudomonas sp. S11A4]MCR8976624.1 hypothetical protein [Pseudomonas sp. S11P7]